MNSKNLIYILAISLFLLNCSSGGDDPTEPAPNNPTPNPNPSGKITYEGNIKAIVNNNCTSCHGSPPTNSAPMSLTTYALVKNAVETRGLIDRINSTTNPMPQSGLMSKANRDLVQQWFDDGLLEN